MSLKALEESRLKQTLFIPHPAACETEKQEEEEKEEEEDKGLNTGLSRKRASHQKKTPRTQKHTPRSGVKKKSCCLKMKSVSVTFVSGVLKLIDS